MLFPKIKESGTDYSTEKKSKPFSVLASRPWMLHCTCLTCEYMYFNNLINGNAMGCTATYTCMLCIELLADLEL